MTTKSGARPKVPRGYIREKDPIAAGAELGLAAAALEQLRDLEGQVDEHVCAARRAGASWSSIARVLGLSGPKSAWARYVDRTPFATTRTRGA
jgi:hypothetical protein